MRNVPRLEHLQEMDVETLFDLLPNNHMPGAFSVCYYPHITRSIDGVFTLEYASWLNDETRSERQILLKVTGHEFKKVLSEAIIRMNEIKKATIKENEEENE